MSAQPKWTRRIQIVFPVPCTADVAWDACYNPAVAAELYQPLMHMAPRSGALPGRFVSGTIVDVTLRVLGIFSAGSQRIHITNITPAVLPTGARTMRDSGRPLTGPLMLLQGWNHEITVWPLGTGGAVWHDELTIQGYFAPVFALVLGPMWRWRKTKIARLARSWGRRDSSTTGTPSSSETGAPTR